MEMFPDSAALQNASYILAFTRILGVLHRLNTTVKRFQPGRVCYEQKKRLTLVYLVPTRNYIPGGGMEVTAAACRDGGRGWGVVPLSIRRWYSKTVEAYARVISDINQKSATWVYKVHFFASIKAAKELNHLPTVMQWSEGVAATGSEDKPAVTAAQKEPRSRCIAT